jgi:ribose-phosphate pyrophosphokinase
VPEAKRTDKLTVLSVAPMLAEAVRRIHNGESVSALFT